MKLLQIAFVLASTSACASSTPSPEPAPGEMRPASTSAASRNRDVILEEEISGDASLKAQNALDVVRQLRPHFLNSRGSKENPEVGQVRVSIDGGRVSPLSDLSSIMAVTVVEIRYLSAAQAMQKFGTQALQGPVITVKTAR